MSINETIPDLIKRLTHERDDAQESANDWQEKYQESMDREGRACTQTLRAEEERDEARRAMLRDPSGLATVTWKECYEQLAEANQQHMLERDAALAAAQRMYDHFIQFCRSGVPAETWAAGSVLLNAALPLQLRRVVPE